MRLVEDARAAGPAALGIDVGGTKIAAAPVPGRQAPGAGLHPPSPDPRGAALDGIERGGRGVISKAPVPPQAVGVGVPSQIDFATGTVLASVNIPLEGVELGKELSRRLELPV